MASGIPIGDGEGLCETASSWRLLTGRLAPRFRHRSYSTTSEEPPLQISTATGTSPLVPALGRLPLQKLAPQHVQAFLNEKLASHLSPRTVQYLRAVLRRALGQAVKWGLVPRNVATLVDPPHVSRPLIEPLTPEEARVLLAAAKGDRLEALFTVAMAVGLRRGEALGLRWPDVDLERGELRVQRALQRIDGKLELVEPKSAMSRRAIRLPQVVIEALRTHRVRQLEERLRGGSQWREQGFVFTTSVGTPLDHGTVIRRFHSILEKAGLRRQRFHDLRHCCATLLLVQGVHPRVVMEILGHSKVSVTLDTYSHVLPVLHGDAAERMDAVLKW